MESVFQRYAIVSEADLREGVGKLAALQVDASRKVLPISTTTQPQSAAADA